jgi:hypothetical protein
MGVQLCVASQFTLGSCRPMDTKVTRMVALVALLIYASETGSALSDLCPGPSLDGTLTIPNTATLQLKASTDGGDATLTGPLGAISGRASVTCQSGEFHAMLYGMSDGSLYRCRGTMDGQSFTGHCVNGGLTGVISGRFRPQP